MAFANGGFATTTETGLERPETVFKGMRASFRVVSAVSCSFLSFSIFSGRGGKKLSLGVSCSSFSSFKRMATTNGCRATTRAVKTKAPPSSALATAETFGVCPKAAVCRRFGRRAGCPFVGLAVSTCNVGFLVGVLGFARGIYPKGLVG